MQGIRSRCGRRARGPRVVKGERQSGHSGFWLCQSAMHCQQNTCPHGVDVGAARAPRHSGQRRCCGTSALPASDKDVPTAVGASSSLSSCSGACTPSDLSHDQKWRCDSTTQSCGRQREDVIHTYSSLPGARTPLDRRSVAHPPRFQPPLPAIMQVGHCVGGRTRSTTAACSALQVCAAMSGLARSRTPASSSWAVGAVAAVRQRGGQVGQRPGACGDAHLHEEQHAQQVVAGPPLEQLAHKHVACACAADQACCHSAIPCMAWTSVSRSCLLFYACCFESACRCALPRFGDEDLCSALLRRQEPETTMPDGATSDDAAETGRRLWRAWPSGSRRRRSRRAQGAGAQPPGA